MSNFKRNNNHINNKGETMLELVISIAIFALMMAFISSAFSAANRIEGLNYDARNEMNKRLSIVANADGSASNLGNNLEFTDERTVSFSIKRQNGISDKGDFKVKNITDKVQDGFEKVGYASKANSTNNDKGTGKGNGTGDNPGTGNK